MAAEEGGETGRTSQNEDINDEDIDMEGVTTDTKKGRSSSQSDEEQHSQLRRKQNRQGNYALNHDEMKNDIASSLSTIDCTLPSTERIEDIMKQVDCSKSQRDSLNLSITSEQLDLPSTSEVNNMLEAQNRIAQQVYQQRRRNTTTRVQVQAKDVERSQGQKNGTRFNNSTVASEDKRIVIIIKETVAEGGAPSLFSKPSEFAESFGGTAF